MTDKEKELIIRAIKGDTEALNEIEPIIKERLEKEIENANPFVDLLFAMFNPRFFADEKSKEDFIKQLRNDVIK